MASTDLAEKMRDALEATLPDGEVAVRRIARQRAIRLAHSQASEKAPASGWLPSFQARRSAIVGGILGVALLAGAFVYRTWSTWAESESVSVGPSLARDLELQSRASRAVDARAAEKEPSGGETTADEAGKAPVSAPSVAARSPKSLPATPAPVTSPPAPASGQKNDRWASVTEAMRRGDWEAAKGVLAFLSVEGDPETRDSARLLRIRIELGTSPNQALDARWQAELSELAQSGSTSSIRASARRLLESPSGPPTSQE